MATQGIAVATGLQGKFDWAGIAGATVGGAATGWMGSRIGGIGSFGANGASNAVGALANAAARSLIDGTDFGDNLIAALPDVIGSTIGSLIGDRFQGSKSSDGQDPTPGADDNKPTIAAVLARKDYDYRIGVSAKETAAIIAKQIDLPQLHIEAADGSVRYLLMQDSIGYPDTPIGRPLPVQGISIATAYPSIVPPWSLMMVLARTT